MKFSRRMFLSLAASAGSLSAFARGARGQVYPSRPITLIVPFAAGGPTDTIARIVTEGMRASLGQPIIIENVGGADGSIAVGRAARAAPDGYTISIGNVATHVYRALRINDRTDPLTEIIARKIINLAQHGERDPIQLRDKSLQTVNWPSLIDLYRFFVRVHGNDEAATVDFERFMSGEIPQHILRYCRESVEMELPSGLNKRGSHIRPENPAGAFSPLAPADHRNESGTR